MRQMVAALGSSSSEVDNLRQKPMDGRFSCPYSFFVPSVPVHPPLLGELESAVMNYFWSADNGDAKSVHAALGKRRGITLNTIQSTLKRLFDKGLLERDKVSHAHVYRARISREAFHRGLVGELVGNLMHGQADAVVSAFVDLAERAGPEHLAKLEALVAERRRKAGTR
jgi:predicted transcriptional regulator